MEFLKLIKKMLSRREGETVEEWKLEGDALQDYGLALGRFIGSRGRWGVEHFRAFYVSKRVLLERRSREASG